MGHCWIAKSAQYNFSVYSNVDADALSRIPRDQIILAESIQTILKAATDGPEALAKMYACCAWVCEVLWVEPPPQWMLWEDWVKAQNEDPGIQQVVQWLVKQELEEVQFHPSFFRRSPDLSTTVKQAGSGGWDAV